MVAKKNGCAVPVITVGVGVVPLQVAWKNGSQKQGQFCCPRTTQRKIHTCVCSLPLKLMERRPLGALKLLWQQNLIKFCQHLQKIVSLTFSSAEWWRKGLRSQGFLLLVRMVRDPQSRWSLKTCGNGNCLQYVFKMPTQPCKSRPRTPQSYQDFPGFNSRLQ